MIYQGTNWPNAYRNRIFMHNLHGRRINQDILQPHGSGYIARHGADFAVTDAPWFRGVAIKSGPDGTVLLSDWNDTGECHDIVNTQKQTGRLYHVRFGTPELVPLDALYGTDRQLIDLLADANEWIARQARLALQERAAEGKLAPTTAAELRACFATSKSPDARLRYLWALHAMRQLDDTLLQRALADHHPWVRAWAIRFAAEDRPPPVKLTEALRARFVQLAQRETSAAVRLHLASVAGRLRTEQRWPIVEALATRFEDRRDQNIPWMIWYAIEPSIPDAKGRDLRLLVTCRLPATRRLVARKLAASGPRHLNRLIASWRQINNDSALRDLLDGTLAGLRGNPGISPPSSWASVAPRLLECANPLLRRRAEKLALLFGDATVRQRLIQIANDPTLPVATRRETIEALLPVADEKLSQAFLPLLQDGEVRDLVLRLLAAHPHPGASERIVHVYPSLSAEEKTLALSVLATRRDFANMMLDAIQSGRIPAQDMTPLIAAQLTQLRDTRLLKRLESAWGRVRPAPSEKQTVINRYRQLLTEDRLATADRTRGHQLFTRRCATCHRLFGEGKEIGPDLTGSQRQNIEYLLQNIVTPNAIVPSVFEAKTFFLRDGRVLTGIVAEKTTETVTVRTSTDYFNLPAASIEDSQTTGLSLMPEGLLADLDDQEIVDLVGYLTGPPAGRGAVTEQQQGERTR